VSSLRKSDSLPILLRLLECDTVEFAGPAARHSLPGPAAEIGAITPYNGNEAARQRMENVTKMLVLTTTTQAEALAADLIRGHAVPETEPEDALHITLAAVHGIQFLATRNCRHIANPANRRGIERICRLAGFAAPVICTPEELLEV
jgi:hypothetical protein